MDMSNFARRFAWQPGDRSTESTDRADRDAFPAPAGEEPGPDGIRWGLVNRIRAEIAAGTYDDGEKWAMAEHRLIERVAGGR
jgi:hypothetical protein